MMPISVHCDDDPDLVFSGEEFDVVCPSISADPTMRSRSDVPRICSRMPEIVSIFGNANTLSSCISGG